MNLFYINSYNYQDYKKHQNSYNEQDYLETLQLLSIEHLHSFNSINSFEKSPIISTSSVRAKLIKNHEACSHQLLSKISPFLNLKVATSLLIIIEESFKLITNKSIKSIKDIKEIFNYYKSIIALRKNIKFEKMDCHHNLYKRLKSINNLFSNLTEFLFDTINLLNENKLLKMGYLAFNLGEDFQPINRRISSSVETLGFLASFLTESLDLSHDFETIKDWWRVEVTIKPEKLNKKRVACFEAVLSISSIGLNLISSLPRAKIGSRNLEAISSTLSIISATLGICRT